MARYIIEGQYTSEILAAMMKNPHDRAEALRPTLDRLGIKLEAYYYAFGSPKFWGIAEVPDTMDPSIIHALMIVGYAGGNNVSLTYTRIYTSAELVDILKTANNIPYRPPTS